jgi:hypothetical protein
LTLNINRAEGVEAIEHDVFLPFPMVSAEPIDGFTAEMALIYLNSIPPAEMYVMLQPFKQRMVASYALSGVNLLYR